MNNALLQPILFGEAARTSTESLDKKVVAVHIPPIGHLSQSVVLLSRKRVLKTISSQQGEMEQYIKPLASRAVISALDYRILEPSLARIMSSAGVNSFGPLAYQLVMHKIRPAWLKSDGSLTKDSQGVWNKMYQLSEKGLYERKWLGEFQAGIRYLDQAKGVNPSASWALDLYMPEDDVSEATFLKHLQEHTPALLPNDFGQFWAYRMVTADPLADQMFVEGEKLITEVSDELGITQDEVRELFGNAGDLFFGRLYHHA